MKNRIKTHYRLFLASPGDVEKERDAVEEVVQYYNENIASGIEIDVIRWENYYTPDIGRPQDVVFKNTQFESIDLFVGIFWSRMGTPTGKTDPKTGNEYISGTMEEIQEVMRQISVGKLTIARFMLYFCLRPIPQENIDQAKLVSDYRKKLKKEKKVAFEIYTSTDDFKYKFIKNLETVAQELKPTSPYPTNKHSKIKVGSLLTKLCNRHRQVYDFLDFFQTKFKECPKRPQFYFIHGNDGEGHESLIKRLMKTCIKEFAEKEWGDQYSTIYFKPIPYPYGGDIEKRKRDLGMNLMMAFDNQYSGTDYSVHALIRLPHLTKHHLVIIEHNTYASKWDRQNSQLINWYLRDYWAALDCDDGMPQFLIFFNVKYPKVKQIIKVFRFENKIKKQLNKIYEMSDTKTPCSVIEELSPVTIEDVKEWFCMYEIYENEFIRDEKINQFFKERDRNVAYKSMSEIELWLEKIYDEYLEERNL